jgi:4-amino-4-deoxy-L-arabinose transferase-like glycosyltransferase
LGLALAAAVLLRQLFLLFIPVLFLWLWICNRWRIDRRLVLSGALITGIVVAAILPFTAYNAQRFHRFVLLNTNAGFAFYWANHPIYGTHFVPILPPEMGTYLDLIPKDLRRLDEAALDQALLKESMTIIAADPGRYALLSLSRIPPFFMFWPSPDSDLISNISRVGGFGLLLPLMLYGLWCAFRPGTAQERFSLSSPLALLMLFILFYTGIHVLSWTLVRYRLPIDSIFILFAGVGLDDLARRVTTRMGWKRTLDAQPRSQG